MAIKEVYERFKHLDDVLLDPSEGHYIRAELWRTIKEESEK